MKNIIAVLTSNRFKSFYWRSGMMVLAGFISLTVEGISDFGFNPQVTVVLGLVLGEVSKFINSSLAR